LNKVVACLSITDAKGFILVVKCFCLSAVVVLLSSEVAVGAKEPKGTSEQKRKIANLLISAFK